MPWMLIAKAFGWRATAGKHDAVSLLVVRHPRLRRRLTGADAWRRAVLLSIRAPEPRDIVDARKEPVR